MFVPRLADIYGRKWVSYISIVITFPCLFGLSLSKSLAVTVPVFFVFGLSSIGRAIVTYVYVLELTPKKYKALIGTCNLCLDTVISLFTTAYL